MGRQDPTQQPSPPQFPSFSGLRGSLEAHPILDPAEAGKLCGRGAADRLPIEGCEQSTKGHHHATPPVATTLAEILWGARYGGKCQFPTVQLELGHTFLREGGKDRKLKMGQIGWPAGRKDRRRWEEGELRGVSEKKKRKLWGGAPTCTSIINMWGQEHSGNTRLSKSLLPRFSKLLGV